MNNIILILSVLVLCGFTRIHDVHDTTQKVDDDFRNMEIMSQPKSWRVFASTPTLSDLEENECIKVSSNNFVSLMCRDNIDIYAVRLSCVTVVR